MRRTLAGLVLAAAVAALATGCGDAGEEGAGAPDPTTASATTGDPGGGPQGGSEPTSSRGDPDGVRIDDFAFRPRTIEAEVGQRVTWTHQDAGVTHTVTADDQAFRSGELEEGETFSHRFTAPGTFAYHCAIHPDMRGTVKAAAG